MLALALISPLVGLPLSDSNKFKGGKFQLVMIFLLKRKSFLFFSF